VDVKEAQKAIETTLRIMIERVKADPNSQKNLGCKKNLFLVMHNGRLFTDMLDYDMSHRAAGGKEIKLHTSFNTLIKCIEHYGNIPRDKFIRDAEQEVIA
jgi:S-adenosylmethionine:tRNA-ribosyltransferase-isomerase (queuine synthetase)